MNILLIDDNRERVAKLKSKLNESTVSIDLRLASCAAEARKLLRLNEFDLLILDINIPRRINGSPSFEVSLDLIDELVDSSSLKKPRHLIGITAFDDAFVSVSERFSERLWSLVRADDMNDDWIESIVSAIEWIGAPRDDDSFFKSDLLVIAALSQPEMAAVHSLPWNWRPEEPADSTCFVRKGSVDVGAGSVEVISSTLARMGVVPAAVRATKLIGLFRPRVCVMVGICAGVRDKVNIGDIIFADPVWDYQSGKWVQDQDGNKKFEIAPLQVPASESIRACMEQMQRDPTWLPEVRAGWSVPSDVDLSLHIGPMASGSGVLADGETISDLRSTQQRQLLGIDMEIYGLFFAASHFSSPKTAFFSLKSVCDFADALKADTGQEYAAYTSAKALEYFVLNHMERLLRTKWDAHSI